VDRSGEKKLVSEEMQYVYMYVYTQKILLISSLEACLYEEFRQICHNILNKLLRTYWRLAAQKVHLVKGPHSYARLTKEIRDYGGTKRLVKVRSIMWGVIFVSTYVCIYTFIVMWVWLIVQNEPVL